MGLIDGRLPAPVHDTRVHMTPAHFNPQVWITWRLNPNGSRYGFSMSTKPAGSGTGNPQVYSCSALLVGKTDWQKAVADQICLSALSIQWRWPDDQAPET